MRVETYVPSVEDLQRVFSLGDVQVKTLLSLLIDVPARIGDICKKVIPKLPSKEFTIVSEKENVTGKVYVSETTLELFKNPRSELPNTPNGIGKVLKKAFETADLPSIHPHVMRKVFWSKGCDLGINRTLLRILLLSPFRRMNLHTLFRGTN
jgi:integrase